MRQLMLGVMIAALGGCAAFLETIDPKPKWQLHGSSSSAGGFTIYVDTATIGRFWWDGAYMRSLFDYKVAQDFRGRPYLSKVESYYYDCKNRRSGLRWCLTHYSGQMGIGSIQVGNQSIAGLCRDRDWTPVAPGSIDEDLWKFACGK